MNWNFFPIHPLNLCEDIRWEIFFCYFFCQPERSASVSQFLEAGKSFSCLHVLFAVLFFGCHEKMIMFLQCRPRLLWLRENWWNYSMLENEHSRYTAKFCRFDRKYSVQRIFPLYFLPLSQKFSLGALILFLYAVQLHCKKNGVAFCSVFIQSRIFVWNSKDI